MYDVITDAVNDTATVQELWSLELQWDEICFMQST